MKLFILIVVLGLGAIAWVNSAVDVAGLDTFDTVSDLSSRQQPDELVVWDNLFDQRAWLKAKLVAPDGCPDTLILGSSTVGQLRADMFGRPRVLNGWLSAPTVEDLEALTVVLADARCVPRQLVLGVDPWLLNAAFGDQRWLSLFDDQIRYQRDGGRLHAAALVARRDWIRFKDLLSFTTTRTSFGALWGRWGGAATPSQPALVRQSPDDYCRTVTSVQYIRAADGHYVSCPSFLRTPVDVAARAAQYVALDTNGIAHWKEVDRERLARLTAVVERWTSAGTAVLMVAPPYHPAAWQALRGNARVVANLAALDRALAALAAANHARYVELRDPANLGCTSAEFEDGHHMQPSCAAKLVARITASR